MKQVRKSVLLWYSPREMYELVTDIPSYPAFLPWCERSEVLQQTDAGMLARLHLGYAGLRHAFTTRNCHKPEQQVHIALVDGPFSLLDGTWQFLPIGAGNQPQACRIEFDLRYDFANPALGGVLSPVFDKIADTLVDSFVRRAESVYGAR